VSQHNSRNCARQGTSKFVTPVADGPAPNKQPLFVPSWFREFLTLLKGAPVSVLLAYASHADRAGFAFPSIITLRRETGYGINCVKQGRAQLVGMGLLIPRDQERKQGKFGRKIFQVAWKASDSWKSQCAPAAAPSTAARPDVLPRTSARKQGQ
jgi:hypothetical protein